MTHARSRLPSRFIGLALCMAAIALTATSPSLADSSAQLAITEAHAEGGTLHILGVNFGTAKPKVTLGTLQLSVASVTATQVNALVPPSVAPGSYLLTVALDKRKSGGDGNEDGNYDEFWITIGAAGKDGAPGPQGAMGPIGAQGPQGAKGETGTAGTVGAKGDRGDKGDAGATGAQGPIGATGPQGLEGDTGSGFQFKGAWSAGAPAFVGDVVAYNGSAFIAVAPTSTSTPPPNSPDWALYVSQGAPGASGAQGPQGTKGDTGATGAQGIKGDTGAIGPQGPQGAQGPQGTKGDTGSTGPQGLAGVVDYTKAIANQTTVQTGASFNIDGSGAIGGNLTLTNFSTAGAGNIMKGGNSFIHNFGVENTFIGELAGNFTMTGFANTASGSQTLTSNTTGPYNTASGAGALYSNTTGSQNTASGAGALSSNTTGDSNTASGAGALGINTTGDSNTASGYKALAMNMTGSNNTASGVSALRNNMTGSNNTASGVTALFVNYSGSNNTASGYQALFRNVTGDSNTASGAEALHSNTTGPYNTASGAGALASNTTGIGNTASGAFALSSNTTANSNTASGVDALVSNTTGGSNTASGAEALHSNTTGPYNTASGAGALASNTTGIGNTASGVDALNSNTTGSGNIGIGVDAGSNLTTGDNNINIGNAGGAAEIGTIRIGTPGVNLHTFIAGIRGVTTAANNAVAVRIDGNGQLGTVSSSRRYKDNIADMDAASSALMKLRPVTFHYKTDNNAAGRSLQYGLIAEEVAEVYPGLIAHSQDGQVETVMYQFLSPMLLNEYQKQQRRIDAQTSKIDLQTKRIADLEQDQRLQRQVIVELQAKTSEIDALRSAMADMGKVVDQVRRTNNITASLPGR